MIEKINQPKKQAINSLGMFDLSRGMLMILVVVGHSITLYYKYWEQTINLKWWILPLLALFMFPVYGLIPMFFMMSGYGFRKRSMKKCMIDRAKYILKPYFYVAIAVTVLAIAKKILLHESIVEALRYQTIPFLLGLCPGNTMVSEFYLGSIGPCWFLVVLAVAWIILNFILGLESEIMQLVCIITLAAVCTRLPFQAFIPFCIVQSLCCVSYLYIGYHIKKTKVLEKNISKKNLFILFLIVLCVCPFGNVEVSQNVWKLGFLDFTASCIAGFLMFRLFISLNRFIGPIAEMIRIVGKYSIYVLCVHTVEYLVVPWDKLAERLIDHKCMGVFVTLGIRGGLIITGCCLITKIVKWRIR